GTNRNLIDRLVLASGKVCFTVDGGASLDLYCSSGESAGTSLIKHITQSDSSPRTIGLTAYKGNLYFISQPTNGFQLWRSDGTAAGTTVLKNFISFLGQSLTVSGDNLFFSAYDCGSGNLGVELWKTDGTTAGTVLVKDIRPGSAS